jgi:hypothetical protein
MLWEEELLEEGLRMSFLDICPTGESLRTTYVYRSVSGFEGCAPKPEPRYPSNLKGIQLLLALLKRKMCVCTAAPESRPVNSDIET